MAVKKTQLYASLWASCDKLRGGMDSSEYKDYILTLLFMKYVTDKFKNKGAYEDIKVFDKAHDKDPDPEKRTGCSFDDFIALKGKKNIGEGMDKIISLPANLFYGTGIAACVLVIDKEGAANRQGIFMIDASRGYVKDGNKNRLRERDIYRIITTFNEQIITEPKYARFVPNDEIEKKNEYNLNITRYIDSTDPEDIQDIYAHIHGGIPAVDIDSLFKYWDVFPSLKTELLTAISEKYYSLNVEHENIRQTIYKNSEFSDYGEKLDEAFAAWKAKEYPILSTLDEDVSARELIVSLAEDILAEFEHLTLIDKYDVYQVLLAYWNEVMNDDVSLIISEPDGYANARATDNIEEEITQGKNKGEMKVTGWEGRLIPKAIMIEAFFRDEKNAIEEAEAIVAETESQLSDLIENADEESALADVAENGKVKAKDIETKIAEMTSTIETEETIELEVILMDLHLVNTKKRLEAYLAGHPLCKSAVNENGKITKSSIEYRLHIIRTEESVPESLQEDVIPIEKTINGTDIRIRLQNKDYEILREFLPKEVIDFYKKYEFYEK